MDEQEVLTDEELWGHWSLLVTPDDVEAGGGSHFMTPTSEN